MKKKMMSAVMAAAVTAALLGGCGGKETSGSPEASGTKEEETTAQGSKETKEEKIGGAGENTEAGNADGGEYTVAVVKQMDHASLDEIAAAVCEELDALAEKNGVSIQYEVYSGQGDQSVLTQIGTQVISEQVDAVIPIATLAAQVMATCAEDTKTPVVYAAISDPEAAEMTDIDYVTGTSDALNTKFILDMMLAQDPEVKKVGLLYSLSEDNSKTPIAEAKAYLEEKGIGYTEKRPTPTTR